MKKVKNRWLIAASAVGVHISIGSIYAYSVMTKPVAGILGVDSAQVKIAFSIAIFFLGLSAAFLGHFVERHGPRKAGMLAAGCYGLGVMGSGLAVSIGSLPLFYLTYGVMGGIGLGVGYITPVSTLVKWFPDKRGLATGLAIMGFGFSSMIFGPLMSKFFIAGFEGGEAVYTAASVAKTLYALGAIYLVVIFCSAQYLAPPPADWKPAGFDPDAANAAGKKKRVADLAQLTANEALRTKRFYYMWVMLFINITCGIAVISVASPMAQQVAGLTEVQAGLMVGLMGLFNGLGRIGWASVSDHLGRPKTYTLFFLIQIAAFMMLPRISSPLAFQLVIFLILTCYGGGFSAVPAFLGDLFGTKQLGAIHGYTLTAWAAAGVVGPSLVTFVKSLTASGDPNAYYANTLYVFAALFGVVLVISFLMMKDISAKRKLAAAAGAV